MSICVQHIRWHLVVLARVRDGEERGQHKRFSWKLGDVRIRGERDCEGASGRLEALETASVCLATSVLIDRLRGKKQTVEFMRILEEAGVTHALNYCRKLLRSIGNWNS